MTKRIISALACAFVGMTLMAQTSPNGKVKAEVKDGNSLVVSYKGNKGWQTIYRAEMPGINKGVEQKIKVRYDMLTGKRLHIDKKGRESLNTIQGGGLLVVRVFDDGVAFRKVSRESVEYNAEEPTLMDFSTASHDWIMKWSDGAEGFFDRDTPKTEGSRWSIPALFEFPNDVFALLHEADIHRDNAASSLYSTGRKGEFRIVSDKNEQKAKYSSWKVLMLGSLSDVVESTLVTDVSTPCKVEDVSWVKPGVVSWVYWAYNHGSNDYNIIKKYVDMAVNLKLPYVLIDAEWDEMKDGKTIEDCVKYALSQGIDPIIWYNSSVGWVNGAPGPKFRLNKKEDREKEFAWCERIGVKGLKIDFFSGENNDNMAYCIDLLEDAAKYHLSVNFHGATVPRGWMRTYPHLLSTEGVYGAEWYNNVPTFTQRAATHNATLPFTRNVVGSMDYTPCAFSDSQHPHITSHAHELALTALYESALQHLADRPESFYAQPQEVKDFLGKLPTVWDETLLLSGYPGKSVVMARRSGKTWYVAGINGTDEPLTLTFDTRRMKKLGKHVVTFQDSGDSRNPWLITTSGKVLTEQKCVARGGFVMVIK